MKKFIAFFVMIYNWFISLFKKEEQIDVEEPKRQAPQYNKPRVPSHNNRKSKRGRYTQYVDLGDGSGRKRPIYHFAK